MKPPEDLGRGVVLARLGGSGIPRVTGPEYSWSLGRRELDLHHLRQGNQLALDRAADDDLRAEEPVALDRRP